MGNLCETNNRLSSTMSEPVISDEKLQMEALRKFNSRVKSHSYPHHGPYHKYIKKCQAQYQLDCITKEYQQGKNYHPNNLNSYITYNDYK